MAEQPRAPSVPTDPALEVDLPGAVGTSSGSKDEDEESEWEYEYSSTETEV
jgi:hypothetical protein